MSIVSSILSAENGLKLGNFSYVKLSEYLFSLKQLITIEEALILRKKILSDSKSKELNNSWASRKELFNLEYVIIYDNTIKHIVQELFGRRISFSYNFTSIYVQDPSLPKHKDRLGCDVNFIIYLGDENFYREDIIITINIDGTDVDIAGRPGDAVTFLGRAMEHSRPPNPFRKNLITTIMHYTFD